MTTTYTVPVQYGQEGYSTTVTSSYTCDSLTFPDFNILCNFSAGHTITLPAVTVGRTLKIFDISGTAATNHITVSPASGTINGAASYVISVAYGSATIQSDGTNWFISSTATAVGTASGDLSGAYPNPVVKQLQNGLITINSSTGAMAFSGSATGSLTTTTGNLTVGAPTGSSILLGVNGATVVCIGSSQLSSGGVGVLELATVTTLPTALPSSGINLYGTLSGQSLGIDGNGISFGKYVSTININQVTPTITSAGAGATGAAFNITGQLGQATSASASAGGTGAFMSVAGGTGGASTTSGAGGVGGVGLLQGGVGGVATSGTGGASGDAIIIANPGGTGSVAQGAGGTVRLRASNLGATSADVITVGPNADGYAVVDIIGGLVLQTSGIQSQDYNCDDSTGPNKPDIVVQFNTTAPRNCYLPFARVGRVIIVIDATGTANTNNITVHGNEGDPSSTINGSATNVINASHGSARYICSTAGATGNWVTF